MSIPGLPALPGDVSGLFSEIISLAADAIFGSSQSQAQWGIYLDGEAVVSSDNVTSVEYRQDFTISNYPIQSGSFASYNKVQHPFEVKVGFSTGGSDADRQAFLASIAAIISDTNLYDFVTPEAIYSNVNITHQDYRINQGNVGLRVVEVWCEEVRPAQTATSSSTPTAITSPDGTTTGTTLTSTSDANQFYSGIGVPQSPGASPQVNDGNVNPVTPAAPYRGSNLGPLQAS